MDIFPTGSRVSYLTVKLLNSAPKLTISNYTKSGKSYFFNSNVQIYFKALRRGPYVWNMDMYEGQPYMDNHIGLNQL